NSKTVNVYILNVRDLPIPHEVKSGRVLNPEHPSSRSGRHFIHVFVKLVEALLLFKKDSGLGSTRGPISLVRNHIQNLKRSSCVLALKHSAGRWGRCPVAVLYVNSRSNRHDSNFLHPAPPVPSKLQFGPRIRNPLLVAGVHFLGRRRRERRGGEVVEFGPPFL